MKLYRGLTSMLLGMVFAMICTVSAMAASDTTSVNNLPEEEGGNNTVTIQGRVEPTIISADITLASEFTILPNETDRAKRFVSPDILVRNTSTIPINLKLVGFKTSSSNAPALVAHDSYTQEQWDALGLRDTKSHIALGLTGGVTSDIWFAPPEQNQTATLGHLAAGGELITKLQAKYGLAWDKQESFQYEMTLELSIDE